MKSEEIHRLISIASELRVLGLVPQELKIVPGTPADTKPIRTTICTATIKYAEWFGLPSSDDAVRYLLLHEGGHQQQCRIVILAIVCLAGSGGGIAAIFGLHFFHRLLLTPAVCCVLLLLCGIALANILLFLSPRRSFQKDELCADRYAAKILRDRYEVDQPSLVLLQVFEYRREVEGRTPPGADGLRRRLARTIRRGFAWLGITYRTHPSEEERIKNIQDTVDQAK